jgi:hypothetical protein
MTCESWDGERANLWQTLIALNLGEEQQ